MKPPSIEDKAMAACVLAVKGHRVDEIAKLMNEDVITVRGWMLLPSRMQVAAELVSKSSRLEPRKKG